MLKLTDKNRSMESDKTNRKRIEKIRWVTGIGSVINLALSGLKLFIGITGKSSALTADGIHSLSDLSTDVIVIFGTSLANRPIDKTHDYGHGKFETIASMLIGFILFAVGIGILKNGIEKALLIIKGAKTLPIQVDTLIIAGLSVILKELLYRYTNKWGRLLNSSALKANAIHHRTDALSSIGVSMGLAGAILLGGKWQILDPIAAIAVGLFIFKSTFSIVKENLEELTEISLDEKDEESIIRLIKGVKGVQNPHNLKTRRIGNNIAIDIHIRVDKNLTVEEGHRIATEVENTLKREYGKETHISVHIEPN